MKTPLKCWLSLAFACLVTALPAAPGQVRVWETNEVIPTYLAAPPSPIPRFYSGRTYQGAKATFYPYPVQDQLTDIKTNKTYNMVYLENDYIKIGVLPEIGGRIFSAVDKSNGYNFFYRQHVIKPALIGMLGAWISGGVEWNIPHHHRASSFMPVEYTTVTNADGSATVWVGETELRHRMRWLVGMTLYPDRSYLELTCKVFNRTPFAHPMLFWINPAVHANTNYQVIFPPSTEWVVQHSKPEFASWPIARQVYGGTDYTRGVDISWWKNHPSPVSFFAWNYEDDWFGGYDHGKQAGVLHVADHNVAPGKKFFEWGNGPEGEMWSKVLTDDDGPYLELMAGAWSDNQPDYSWIQPGETREWQHWWYPIRDMGGVKMATKDYAINLEVTNRVAKLAINTTAKREKVNVRLENGTNTLLNKTLSIAPAHPFTASVPLAQDINPEQITVWVASQNWSPQKPKGTPMPKAVERPKNPKDYFSSDEIYHTGQRIEQLYSPSFDPAPYYQEILRRDPSDYRAATAMGVLLCKQLRWVDARLHLLSATERASDNHIRPKDGEAFYYLGVALRASLHNPLEARDKTRLEETFNAFQKASWSVAWRSASYYQLAEIEAQRQEYALALNWINRALELNQHNPQALNLKSSVLRYSGQFSAALDCSTMAQRLDPLDYQSKFESALAKAKFPSKKVVFGQIEQSMLTKKQTALFSQLPFSIGLEMIVSYRNAGFSNEVAFFAQNGAKCALMQALFPKTLTTDKDYALPARWTSFPFQHETIAMLASAGSQEFSPASWYFMGCLLFDTDPDRAASAWTTAEQQAMFPNSNQPDLLKSLICRNLGLYYSQHRKEFTNAIVYMEKAVQLNRVEPRFLYELDMLFEAGGTAVKRRLEWLTATPDVTTLRDDSLTRLILVYLADGQLDKALEILTTHRFHNWEGSSNIRNVYVDARLLRGQQHLRTKRTAEALKDFEAALEFPANLEVGRPRRDAQAARIAYHIGLAHEALGSADKAKEFFTQASGGRGGRGGGGATDANYYHAMALQKLGRAFEANVIFDSLIKQGQELQTSEPADYFAKFGEKRAERVRKADAHYLTGLGHLGLGKKAEADAEFKAALELHPAHLGALEVMKR